MRDIEDYKGGLINQSTITIDAQFAVTLGEQHAVIRQENQLPGYHQLMRQGVEFKTGGICFRNTDPGFFTGDKSAGNDRDKTNCCKPF